MAWMGGNRYLSEEQAKNNVLEMYNILGALGWTKNAVSAVGGNYFQESTVNPNIWQNLDEGNTSLGYGLGQWTPATKLITWAGDRGLDYTSGDTQCNMLDQDAGQWHRTGNPSAPSPSPLITWEEFKTSNLDVDTLTRYFYYWWEDPSYSDTTLGTRLTHAAEYFELLGGVTPKPPVTKKKMPFWFYVLGAKKGRSII